MFATETLPAASRLEMLETMQPGPELAAALDGVDRDSLSGDELASVMIAHQRLASHYSGQVYQDNAAIAEVVNDFSDEYHHTVENTAAEIGAALCLTRRSAESETHLALELTTRLPQVLEALLAGGIDVRRAQVLVRGTDHLPIAAARGVVDGILDDASRLTTGSWRRSCDAAASSSTPTPP